jgi:hypothetical protein
MLNNRLLKFPNIFVNDEWKKTYMYIIFRKKNPSESWINQFIYMKNKEIKDYDNVYSYDSLLGLLVCNELNYN